ncbi:hypothetical protein [Nitrococcus mobilis]|uniref:hypothetical protein n=1 Tax=Nitrococcus mobilis TaxID=35797 RepID=UPI001E493AA6|nr:hypothetical protein [Nitrococcus mobilis]
MSQISVREPDKGICRELRVVVGRGEQLRRPRRAGKCFSVINHHWSQSPSARGGVARLDLKF